MSKVLSLDTLTFLDHIQKDLKTISGANCTLKSAVAIHYYNATGKVFIICPTIKRAVQLYDELTSISYLKVKLLPSEESSPYEMTSNSALTQKEKLESIESLISSDKTIVVTTVKALFNSYQPLSIQQENSIELKINQGIDVNQLIQQLMSLGYKRNNMVLDPGDFSVRGYILDIYPITTEPVRIELFDEEIETIRIFDKETQLSIRNLESITIRANQKVKISEKRTDLLNHIQEAYQNQRNELDVDSRELLHSLKDNLTEQIESSDSFEGIDYLAPFLYPSLSDITEYLPPHTVIFFDYLADIHKTLKLEDDRLTLDYQSGTREGRILQLPYLLHSDYRKLIAKLNTFSCIDFTPLETGKAEAINFECQKIQLFARDMEKAVQFIHDLKTQGIQIFITTDYPQRVLNILKEKNIDCLYAASEEDMMHLDQEKVIIAREGPQEAFYIEDARIAVITDHELFGKNKRQATVSKKLSQKENLDFIISLNDLKPGDLVVHSIHGIGKYVGLRQITLDQETKEYLTVEYQGQDRLHVPIENLNILARYRGNIEKARISKMGGAQWEKIKSKVKKAIDTVAQELVILYAQRNQIGGISHDPDTKWQEEMEAAFPYTETPDQMQAIIDTKNDLESMQPMDRLICGDVGFGKTEVAIRAIFKVVNSGRQTIMLAPTTLLAQQHFNVISDRLLPYPTTIALLTRFQTPKEQKEIISNLKNGKIDIVVGTHRLLQKDISFHNPGLLVIDEEHKFGVTHKEKIKQLKADIDVLSMSATPIPRTLHMSLSGIRKMSLISTPPVNRLPIKTYVAQFNISMIKRAITHEIERNGQVFFVHNRIDTISKFALDIAEMVPDAKICVAHGQMSSHDLEAIMLDFAKQKYDVLVCTTIIESGLDMPNVNTIIINNADKFGLAQLYQLRGRVGRTDKQAYAYCLYSPNKILTQEAIERLNAIKDFTTLGSGYHIAMRDLEIRGVGNILGEAQHGHMIEVGFDLYCEMLDGAIKELCGEKVTRIELPSVDINVTAYLPEEWVGSYEQKMIEYKRLSQITTEQHLGQLQKEWLDRFGKIPLAAEQLLRVMKIRLLAFAAGFLSIKSDPEKIRILGNYSLADWMWYHRNLPPKFSSKCKWREAGKNESAHSVLWIENTSMTPHKQLEFIEEFFSNVRTIKEQKGDK